MPLYEHQPVKVTLIVEVDGHTLRFEETGEAKGARYHGADPREQGYSTSDTLESSVRGLVSRSTAAAANRAMDTARDRVAAFAHALQSRPDEHEVLTVATRASGHEDVTLTLGDLRELLWEETR